jgi:hypothetical protein
VTTNERSKRLRTLVAGALTAGGMLLAAPAGVAVADISADNPGRPGEVGGPPGSFVKDDAKEPGSVPSQYGGKAPGQFVKDGTPPGCSGGGGGGTCGGEGPGGT